MICWAIHGKMACSALLLLFGMVTNNEHFERIFCVGYPMRRLGMAGNGERHESGMYGQSWAI